MPERYNDRVHTEHAVLDIGDDVGALIIYCRPELRGKQIDISLREREWQRVHTDVLERRANDRPIFAALFFSLTALNEIFQVIHSLHSRLYRRGKPSLSFRFINSCHSCL